MSRFRVPEIFLGCILTVAVFSMGILFASSFQPQNYKQATATEQHSADKKTENNENAQSLWVPVDSVGLYTLVLAVFTGLLTLVSSVQGYFLLRADKTARIAATAAKDSADASIASERARLFPFIKNDSFITLIRQTADRRVADDDVAMKAGRWWINGVEQMKYSFRNFGKTPAIIHEISHGSIISENLPSVRNYSILVPLPIRPMIGANESCESIVFDQFPQLTGSKARSINNAQGTFWFYGRIIYDDMFGWQRTFEFVWHYSAISNGFSLLSYEETQARREN